ncbi:2,3-dihydro-2,3-dihydroxybenzoate dehydrogenase [Frankia sp. AgPm24]|uniref:2,3-dihydro-2,3-dihydroxybenzoate dehydrogenase n=1 Tax=Frankia sp. AgPm24 TaxID=631128 RepID=UPI0020100CE8|nr:2,3-dihydro-2,3-dihydroxybenzoate dehydrogenase [Frankia sp. AgPm24]MCK9920725.1 2,3-dihydro-2,3-dihydroxybenzoate dehydrogenase [Frankia sp. AgPm24]
MSTAGPRQILDLDVGVAVVSGAAGGIGAAVVEQMAHAGARVVAVDRDQARLERLATVYRADGLDVTTRCLDVGAQAAVAELIDWIERTIGPIDALVNGAGVLRTGPVCATSAADWAEVFTVNATGVFHLSQAVAARMAPRRRGSIVTIASNAAGVPRRDMAAYAASKAAAAHFTRCLGLELGPLGIRCNVVSPGSTDTAMGRAAWPGDDGVRGVITGSLADYRTGIPLGRVADPHDVADAVLFLLSERSRHVVLHDLYVDGGATLRA